MAEHNILKNRQCEGNWREANSLNHRFQKNPIRGRFQEKNLKLEVPLVLIYTFVVFNINANIFADDKYGLISEGNFVSEEFGLNIPVDDSWYIPVLKSGKPPPLAHRISSDQVLTIIFSKEPFAGSCREQAKDYLRQLLETKKSKVLKNIVKFKTSQKIESYYFEIESISGEPKYRQGWFCFKVNDEGIVAISTIETTEDKLYMDKAYALLGGVFFPKYITKIPSKMELDKNDNDSSKNIGSNTLGASLVVVISVCFGAFLLRILIKRPT